MEKRAKLKGNRSKMIAASGRRMNRLSLEKGQNDADHASNYS